MKRGALGRIRTYDTQFRNAPIRQRTPIYLVFCGAHTRTMVPVVTVALHFAPRPAPRLLYPLWTPACRARLRPWCAESALWSIGVTQLRVSHRTISLAGMGAL